MKKLFLTTTIALLCLSFANSIASDSIIRSVEGGFQVLDFKLNDAGPFQPADTAKVTTYETEVDAINAATGKATFDWDKIVGSHQATYSGFVISLKTVSSLNFTHRLKAATSLKNKVFDRIVGNSKETFVPGYSFNDLIGARFLLRNDKETKDFLDYLLKAPALVNYNLKARPSYDEINHAISVDFKDIPYLGKDGYEYPSIGEIQVWAKPTGMWLNQQHDTVYKGDKSSAYYKQLLKPFTNLHLFMCRILSKYDFQITIKGYSADDTKKAFDEYIAKMTEAEYTKALTDAYWGNIPNAWKAPEQGGRWTVDSIQLILNQLEESNRFNLDTYFNLN